MRSIICLHYVDLLCVCYIISVAGFTSVLAVRCTCYWLVVCLFVCYVGVVCVLSFHSVAGFTSDLADRSTRSWLVLGLAIIFVMWMCCMFVFHGKFRFCVGCSLRVFLVFRWFSLLYCCCWCVVCLCLYNLLSWQVSRLFWLFVVHVLSLSLVWFFIFCHVGVLSVCVLFTLPFRCMFLLYWLFVVHVIGLSLV